MLEKNQFTRRYLFKLYPTASQDSSLHEQRKMMADLWNALKQRREDVYRREGRSLTYFDLTNEITTLRHECPEWAEIPAITAHRVAKWLIDSYQAFFRRVKLGEAPGYPKWRSRERATTIPLGTMDKTGWHFEQRNDNPFSWQLHYKSITNVKDRTSWIHARGRVPARRETGVDDAPVNRLGGNKPRSLDESVNYRSRFGGDTESESNISSLRLARAKNPAPISSWRNADIIWRAGTWWLSVCVDMEARRQVGRCPITVSFNLLDELASVNGVAETPTELLDALALDADVDRLKSHRDIEFPRGTKLSDDKRERLDEANIEIARLSAFIVRKRRNALHNWSSRVIARASDLTIITPPIRTSTKTPRGNKEGWGAQVEVVSTLNRHVLSQAPMTAIQMLKYKAEEAGIRCDVVADEAPVIAVGGDLVVAGKQLRHARRTAKRKAA